MQLSTGPWSYNRFTAYEQSLTEGAKPDFLDMDKDGDKEEPMKKAIKEKGSKKCDDCGSEHCDCDDKKEVKESLSGERYKKALEKGAMYSRKESEDVKKRGKVGGRGGRSDFGDGDRGSGNKNKRRRGVEVEEMEEQAIQTEGNCYQSGGKVKGYQKGGKVKSKELKEALINSIMGDGLANNPVSAEIIVEHMSDEWVEAILDDLSD